MSVLFDSVAGKDEPEGEFRPPLPMEDRLWRHPSEVAAVGRAAGTASITRLQTPWKHAFGLASVGAVGGALIVTGLFLSFGGTASTTVGDGPAISLLSTDPIVPRPIQVDADNWPTAVVEAVQPGVAAIEAGAADNRTSGSGVIFRSDGLLLTSFDLVHDSTELVVTLHDGVDYDGEVVGVDHISGLAVVRIAEKDIPTARLAIPKKAPEVGDYAVALRGRADPQTLDLALISSMSVDVPVSLDQNLHGLIQLDRGMPRAASGGGVIDDGGSVIGIIVDVETVNATYAVPIGYARKIAEDILHWGEAKHSWLGIRGVDLDPDMAADYSLDGGVRITSVISTSPAANAGMNKGDLITAIDGTGVISMTELILELRKHPPNEAISIYLMRNGSAKELQLDLAIRKVGDTT